MKKALSLILLCSILILSFPNQAQASYVTSFYSTRDNIIVEDVLAGIPQAWARDYMAHFIENTGSYVKVPNSSNMSSFGTDGTYDTNIGWASKGCYHYSDFVAVTMYGTKGARRYIHEPSGSISPNGLKSFLETYAQAGEHLRIDNRHSLNFISSTDIGFYTLQYYGEASDPFLSFSSYEYFADVLNNIGLDFFIFDSDPSINNPSSYDRYADYDQWDKKLLTGDRSYSWTINLNMPLDESTVNSNSVYILDSKGNKLDFIYATVTNGARNGAIRLNNYGEFQPGEDYMIVVEDTIRSRTNRKMKNGLVIKFVYD